MRQQNRKGNFNKHTNNAYGYGNPNEYDHYMVEKPAPLLEWLMENVKGPSKTKVKQTLQVPLKNILLNSEQSTFRRLRKSKMN